jgi:hypothetical protein
MLQVKDRKAPFEAISFKDVGMSVPKEHRQFVYESIAESLALQLSSDDRLPMSSQVRYSRKITKPEHHRHCEAKHIYVDLWHNASSEHWGYSLWSGCGAEDRFAWKKVSAPKGNKDAVASIEPLARDIASSLRQAVQNECFRRTC